MNQEEPELDSIADFIDQVPIASKTLLRDAGGMVSCRVTGPQGNLQFSGGKQPVVHCQMWFFEK